MKLSNNFTRAEFERSATASAHGVDNRMNTAQLVHAVHYCITIAEPWRLLAGGIPMRFSSMFRGPALNALIPNSAKMSSHMMARAGDKPLGAHRKRYRNLDEMYEEFILSPIPYDKAIIELNRKGQRWIHTQIPIVGEAPRRLCYNAVENSKGEMVYTRLA